MSMSVIRHALFSLVKTLTKLIQLPFKHTASDINESRLDEHGTDAYDNLNKNRKTAIVGV